VSAPIVAGPLFSDESADGSDVVVGAPGDPVPSQLPMLVARLVTFAGIAAALGLAAWQVQRSIAGEPHDAGVTWLSVLAAVGGAIGVLVWTWIVVENARRLLEVSRVTAPPDPLRAVGAWALPIGFAVASAILVTWLTVGAGNPSSTGSGAPPDSSDAASSIPFGVACVCLLLFLPLLYRPLSVLSGVVRRLGGSTVDLVQWVWVPVVIAAVGVGSLAVLRLLGMLDDTGELAPTWAIAAVSFGPAVLLVVLGWRSAAATERAVDAAFARRAGLTARPRGRRSRSTATDHGTIAAARGEVRGRVHQLPGPGGLRIALVTMVAGIALVGLIAAIVTFMFWNESRDGVLIQSQRDRAVDVLETLRDVERAVAFVALCTAALWTFLAVANVRLASGRRRNPLLAALAWPAAGIGIWIIGERFRSEGSTTQVIVGMALQATVLYAPFLLLERAADAVGARQTPFRITWAFGVVLLVHIEGLAGLSTIGDLDDPTSLGRTAGYLLLGSLVTLLSTLAITDACTGLEDATAHEAEHHNFLVAQRDAAAAAMPAAGS
jgi:hypothetical protein